MDGGRTFGEDLERILRKVLALTPLSWWTVVAVVVGLGACLLVWGPLVRRTGWVRWPTLAAELLLVGTLALTLTPGGSTGPGGVRSCVRAARGLDTQVLSVATSAEALLNLVLLVPLGLALVLATRGVVLPVLVVLALPGFVELTQTRVPGRVCSGVDYLTNVTGGLAGVIAGVVVLGALGLVRRARLS